MSRRHGTRRRRGQSSEEHYHSFVRLRADLIAIGIAGAEATLVNRSTLVKIARYAYNATTGDVEQIGAAFPERVSDSLFATVASGSGTAYVVDANQPDGDPHNLPTSGTVTFWDRVTNATVGEGVGFTRSGNNLTLDTSVTAPAGSIVNVEGVCEYGELRDAASGGQWVPQQQGGAYWKGGLWAYGAAATGLEAVDFLPGLGFGTVAAPKNRMLVGLCDTEQSGAGSLGTGIGLLQVGQLDGVRWFIGPTAYHNGTDWIRAAFYNSESSPLVYVGAAVVCGDPAGVSSVRYSLDAGGNDGGTTYHYSYQVASSGLTGGAPLQIGSTTTSILNWLASRGPAEGLSLHVGCATGSARLRLRQIHQFTVH